MTPLVGIGAQELLIILAIIVLLFGASKLPELARGSGRALRIFKAETKGLTDDDDTAADTTEPAGPATASQPQIQARQVPPVEPVEPVQPVADPEAPRLRRDDV